MKKLQPTVLRYVKLFDEEYYYSKDTNSSQPTTSSLPLLLAGPPSFRLPTLAPASSRQYDLDVFCLGWESNPGTRRRRSCITTTTHWGCEFRINTPLLTHDVKRRRYCCKNQLLLALLSYHQVLSRSFLMLLGCLAYLFENMSSSSPCE